MNELVSVIVPHYNSAYLKDCIDSIFLQSYRPIEVVIVDDCSDTKPINYSYNDDSFNVVLLCNSKNLGAGRTRIRGIQRASGRFISFLDSDDVWCEDKLEKQIKFMIDNDIHMSWTGYSYCNSQLSPMVYYMPPKLSSYPFFITKAFTIGCLTVIYDRKFLKDPQKAELIMRNDYEMWLQLFEQIKDSNELKADVFPFFTGLHRLHNSSLTKSKLKSAYYWWKYLCLSKHFLATRLFCYLCYFIFTIKLRFFNFDKPNDSNHLNSLI